jgi:hypothetical protein
MIMMMKRTTLLFIATHIFAGVFAQLQTTLPSITSLYQSNYTNPGFMPEYNVQVGLPGLNNIGTNVGLIGITPQRLYKSIDQDNYLSLDRLVNKIPGKSIGLRLGQHQDLFFVGFPIKDYHVSIGAANTILANVAFSKQFLGGDIFVAGRQIDFSGTVAQLIAYSNVNVGVTKRINDKFTVGGRFKYLLGHAYTALEDFSITTSAGAQIPYPVSLRASGRLVTSGLPLFADSITGEQPNDADKELDLRSILKPSNRGAAIDLGVTYQLDPKISLYAAITDLGFINWKNKAFQYDMGKVDITFNGFSYSQLNNSDERSDYIESLGIIENAEIKRKSFRRMLPARYMLGGDYQFYENHSVGLILQMQTLKNYLSTAYTLNYTTWLTKNWQFTANYSLVDHSRSLIGLGGALKLGPIQLFFIQNDILSLIRPTNLHTISFSMGLNVAVGKISN